MRPPLPGQPPGSIFGQNVSNNSPVTKGDKPQDISRNFVWGTCHKNKQCRFRHELIFEEMKDILKFCHDYQNPSGCIREHCSYLHTTKEEENLFFTEHILPRVLEERHHAMRMSTSTPETNPQTALFVNKSLVGPPPSPPLLPQTTSVRTPTQFVDMASMLPLPTLPPPPPPPPPTPTQPSSTVHSPVIPGYTAPPPQSASLGFVMNQPPLAVPDFNPSIPPPVTNQIQIKSSTMKRLTPSYDAGATKKRRTEDIIADTPCEQCLLRNRRIEAFKEEIDKLSSEEEYQMLTHKKKLEEYTNKKKILGILISPDILRFVEEYVEGVPQLDTLSQLSRSWFLTTPTPVLRIEDLLQAARRPAASPSQDLLRAQLSLFDLLANSPSSERLSESETKSPGSRSQREAPAVSAGHMQPAVAPYSGVPPSRPRRWPRHSLPPIPPTSRQYRRRPNPTSHTPRSPHHHKM